MVNLMAALSLMSPAFASRADAPIIGGYGKWRYQYMPELLQLPPGGEVQDAHGLELDDEDNIYLTYANWNNGVQTNGTDQECLVRWAPDGTNGAFMDQGGPALCSGKPHGLKLAREADGVTYLYHSNVAETSKSHSGKLSKTTLEGKIIWQINGTFGQQDTHDNYRPCWWGVPPTGPYVYLADGYGSSNVYVFTRDGRFTNRTFGGRGKEHGKFETCHGITYDPRAGLFAVADRENHRIEMFDFDARAGDTFAYRATVNASSMGAPPSSPITPAGFRPCNFRVLENAQEDFLEGMVVVPALEGPVAILDKSNKLVSVIDVGKLIGDRGSLHPHDALMLRNGDVVVGTWNPGYVSYWKLLR
jgi:hypothetical protein